VVIDLDATIPTGWYVVKYEFIAHTNAMAGIISVKLTPKASSNRMGETRKLPDGSEQLAVYVTAAPDKGKANESLLRLLAKHLEIPATRL
jgi:uncharacterized protein YggU (UPF0235/DUF167 family)